MLPLHEILQCVVSGRNRRSPKMKFSRLSTVASVTLLMLLSSSVSFADALEGVSRWYYVETLPQGQVSVLASGIQKGKFDCAITGVFSVADFQAHFAPQRGGPYAMLVTVGKEVAPARVEQHKTRPCLKWETSDGGPDFCSSYDHHEYRFKKTFGKVKLSASAELTMECSDLNRGAERIEK